MTRKHFEWAAQFIALCMEGEQREGARCFAVALFSHFNPRFDRERFERRVEEYATGRKVAP